MKCVLKKGLAVAFASLLSLGMVFAQEEIEEAGQGFSIGLYDKPYSTTYEISLNAEDYSNSVPGFWVDWKDIPESSRELNWSSSDMNIIKVDMKAVACKDFFNIYSPPFTFRILFLNKNISPSTLLF